MQRAASALAFLPRPRRARQVPQTAAQHGGRTMCKRARSLLFSAALAACGMTAVAPAFANAAASVTSDDHPLVEMNHKSWTARDGAPQGVRALALSPDGTLWIGSEGGLFNFDGRTF